MVHELLFSQQALYTQQQVLTERVLQHWKEEDRVNARTRVRGDDVTGVTDDGQSVHAGSLGRCMRPAFLRLFGRHCTLLKSNHNTSLSDDSHSQGLLRYVTDGEVDNSVPV